jgi:hypothetical protein
MESRVYRDTLNSVGIDHRVPGAEQRLGLNWIIFDELVRRTAQGRIPTSHAGLLHRGDVGPERGRLRSCKPGP